MIKDFWHAWVEQGWDYDYNDSGGKQECCIEGRKEKDKLMSDLEFASTGEFLSKTITA